MGFEKTMNAILDNLPTEDRQTLLFSATQTRSVKGKSQRSKFDLYKKFRGQEPTVEALLERSGLK